MIFGRKKRQDDAAAEPEVEESSQPSVEDEQDESDAPADSTDGTDGTETTEASPADHESGDESGDESDEESGEESGEPEVELVEIAAEALDAQDWRTSGPWDTTEVDEDRLVADENTPRIDLGSIILTGTEGMELQLQVADETQQIVSAMMIVNEQVDHEGETHELSSALEVAAFAAPRSGGFWSEIREEMIEGAEASGGTGGLAEGPFGVEVRRLLLVETPDGEQGYQPSRMWVVEGPRWILRGVVYGHAALEGVPGGHVERIADMFRDIVVRRGDEPMAPGDLLTLQLPENMVEEATEEP